MITATTRANLMKLIDRHRTAPIPDIVLKGGDWSTWVLDVLLATEPDDRDDRHTEVVYRACGRCLQPWGMAALVFGHACPGEPHHFPTWVRRVLWAVA